MKFFFTVFFTGVLTMNLIAGGFPVRETWKAELHTHLTGSYSESYIESIATPEQMAKIRKNRTELQAGSVSYHDAFKHFLAVEEVVNTIEKVENGVAAFGKELLDDHVSYVEIRAGLKDFGEGHEEYLKAILRGIEQMPAGIEAYLILSFRRNTSPELVKKTIDLAIKYKDKVVGIDISGDTMVGTTTHLAEEVARAKAEGLFLALHIGEAPGEIDSKAKMDDQLKVLELLKPDRLGHAVFLSKEAKQWVLDHPSVVVEVCPTSSVLAHMIDSHHLHPWLEFYLKHDHPIVIGADDTLIFGNSLSSEFELLLDHGIISESDAKKMIGWSFKHSFAAKRRAQ